MTQILAIDPVLILERLRHNLLNIYMKDGTDYATPGHLADLIDMIDSCMNERDIALHKKQFGQYHSTAMTKDEAFELKMRCG